MWLQKITENILKGKYVKYVNGRQSLNRPDTIVMPRDGAEWIAASAACDAEDAVHLRRFEEWSGGQKQRNTRWQKRVYNYRKERMQEI